MPKKIDNQKSGKQAARKLKRHNEAIARQVIYDDLSLAEKKKRNPKKFKK